MQISRLTPGRGVPICDAAVAGMFMVRRLAGIGYPVKSGRLAAKPPGIGEGGWGGVKEIDKFVIA